MDPSSVPRVWEARFQYHLKKKQVKLQLIAKIVKEQRKKNEEEAERIRLEELQRSQLSQPLIKMGTIISVK
jgi:hypothetical protein